MYNFMIMKIIIAIIFWVFSSHWYFAECLVYIGIWIYNPCIFSNVLGFAQCLASGSEHVWFLWGWQVWLSTTIQSGLIGPKTYHLCTHQFPSQVCESFRGSDHMLFILSLSNVLCTKKAFSEHFLNVY